MQWDHLGKEILHLDFSRVSAEEIIETEVAVELRGQAAGIANGGILEHLVHSLSINCKAGAIPDSIKVDISHLQIDEGIHVRDLVLPPDVTVNADPDVLLVARGRARDAGRGGRGRRRKSPRNPRSSNPNARKKRRKIESGSLMICCSGWLCRSRDVIREDALVTTAGGRGFGDDQIGGRPGQSRAASTREHGTTSASTWSIAWRRAARPASFSSKFEGQLAEIEIDYRRVLLLKPQTFMNLSGRSVGQAVRFYKLPLPTSWSCAMISACRSVNFGSGPEGPTAVKKAARHRGSTGNRPVPPAQDRDRRERRRRCRRLRLEPVPRHRTKRHR